MRKRHKIQPYTYKYANTTDDIRDWKASFDIAGIARSWVCCICRKKYLFSLSTCMLLTAGVTQSWCNIGQHHLTIASGLTWNIAVLKLKAWRFTPMMIVLSVHRQESLSWPGNEFPIQQYLFLWGDRPMIRRSIVSSNKKRYTTKCSLLFTFNQFMV